MAVSIIVFIVIGIAGGLIGGMGMGGGTLLIPLLTVLTDTPQHVAQAVNLIAFIPMSLAALVVHAKNKLIDYKLVPLMAIPAVVSSVLSALLAKSVSGGALRLYFGIFLTALGVWQLACMLLSFIKKKREEKKRAKEMKAQEEAEKIIYYQ